MTGAPWVNFSGGAHAEQFGFALAEVVVGAADFGLCGVRGIIPRG
jgi:hypothetical protein